MAKQECPKCGTKFRAGSNWANFALSTLIIAPAVPHVAKQVCCPKCGYPFADGEVRHWRSSWSKSWAVLLALLCVGFLIWALS
jgi:uncharacterized paraquat-inducible protein A